MTDPTTAVLSTVLAVAFYGEQIQVIRQGADAWLPLAPLCKRFGLMVHGQAAKLTATPWATTQKICAVAGDGKEREMLCLHLRSLAGWLFSISPDRVRPALREGLIRYQREAADALYRYLFTGEATTAAHAVESRAAGAPLPAGDPSVSVVDTGEAWLPRQRRWKAMEDQLATMSRKVDALAAVVARQTGKPTHIITLNGMKLSDDFAAGLAVDVEPDNLASPVQSTAKPASKPTGKPRGTGVFHDPGSPCGQVFDHWVSVMSPGERPFYTRDTERPIRARLTEGYTVEQLCQAITGATHEDWLMGRAKGSPGYKGLSTLLRDAPQVDKLIALYRRHHPAATAAPTPEPATPAAPLAIELVADEAWAAIQARRSLYVTPALVAAIVASAQTEKRATVALDLLCTRGCLRSEARGVYRVLPRLVTPTSARQTAPAAPAARPVVVSASREAETLAVQEWVSKACRQSAPGGQATSGGELHQAFGRWARERGAVWCNRAQFGGILYRLGYSAGGGTGRYLLTVSAGQGVANG